MAEKMGILLTNTGTPDAPTPDAVRRYLCEFLSDKRIVQLPRLVWLPILYGLILPTRPSKSAALYQQIWTPEGAPMRVIMQSLRHKLSLAMPSMPIAIGMNYGNPSIPAGITELQAQGCEHILVLPLYPQYSDTTTASTFDRVERTNPTASISRVTEYASHSAYIRALAASVQTYWQQHQRGEHLLVSFHGIPERFVKQGDPYQSHCEQTATLLAQALALTDDQWTLCYQSQFGYDKWLKPSTQQLLTELPQRGLRHVDIICPGFAVDCLETLEEIAIRGQESFIDAGGTSLRYIPALNDSDAHVDLLASIIRHAC